MKHILDKGFKYDPSHDTDIRRRFDAIDKKARAALKEAQKTREEAESVLAKTRIKGKAA